jgi:hypothetical protein
MRCSRTGTAKKSIRDVLAQDPFMATFYRTALIVALEEFFGRVQIFGDTLTLAKYCQKMCPS